MMTWVERRERWRLLRKLRRLEKEYKPEPNLTADEFMSLAAEYSMERKPIQHRLWAIETARLCRWADRLAIDVEIKWDDAGRGYGHAFFSKENRNALKRAIRAERREAGRFWAALLVPILSLLVALAALVSR